MYLCIYVMAQNIRLPTDRTYRVDRAYILPKYQCKGQFMPSSSKGPEVPFAQEFGFLPDLVMQQLQIHIRIAHTQNPIRQQLCTEIRRKAIIKQNPVRARLQLELRYIDWIRQVYTPMLLKVLKRDHTMSATLQAPLPRQGRVWGDTCVN
jgi:hypothetical protein